MKPTHNRLSFVSSYKPYKVKTTKTGKKNCFLWQSSLFNSCDDLVLILMVEIDNRLSSVATHEKTLDFLIENHLH